MRILGSDMELLPYLQDAHRFGFRFRKGSTC